MNQTKYRITFTIERQQPGEKDFTEIGFGSTCSWDHIEAALYDAQSTIQNRAWETEDGMPDPEDIPLDDSERSDETKGS